VLRSTGTDVNIAPEKLLARYPLGYLIFYADDSNKVVVFDKRLALDKFDLDWSVVGLTRNIDGEVQIRLPDVRAKNGTLVLSHALTGGPIRIGDLGGAFFDDIVMSGEIIAIDEDGFVFIVGCRRIEPPEPKQARSKSMPQ